MLKEVADFPFIEIDQTGYNLIPSRFPPVPLYERLNSSRSSDFSEVEILTNPRLKEKQRLSQRQMARDERCPSLQNWNHAPFAYPNPEGSRFFNPNINCLEISCDPQTALATSVRKRERFLERTSEDPVNLDMRMLSRPVKGKFADLRQLTTSVGKVERWDLGFQFAQNEIDGVIFRSHLRPSGMCLGILNNRTLGKAVQGNHYSFAWDGTQIRSLYSFNEEANVINPLDLFLDEKCVAA
jgi:hypothetical protein